MKKGMRKFTLMKTKKGYRWQIKSANGEIVDASTEDFASQVGACDNFLRSYQIMGLFVDDVQKIKAEIILKKTAGG